MTLVALVLAAVGLGLCCVCCCAVCSARRCVRMIRRCKTTPIRPRYGTGFGARRFEMQGAAERRFLAGESSAVSPDLAMLGAATSEDEVPPWVVEATTERLVGAPMAAFSVPVDGAG